MRVSEFIFYPGLSSHYCAINEIWHDPSKNFQILKLGMLDAMVTFKMIFDRLGAY